MRKLSLLTYSIYELKKIDFDHSLRIMNMLYDAENDNVRLQVPLAIWLYLNNRGDLETGPKLKKIVKDIFDKYPKVSEANALNYLKKHKNLEFRKFYESYTSENLRRDENQFKDKMRSLIKALKKEKNLSNYKICKIANIDMGNFHAYINLNNNNRLSKDKIKTVVKLCNDLA